MPQSRLSKAETEFHYWKDELKGLKHSEGIGKRLRKRYNRISRREARQSLRTVE